MVKHKKKTKKTHYKDKLNPKRVGYALGKVVAIYVILLALMSSVLGWGTAIVHLMGSLYIGYNTSFVGVLIGAFWGFFDGFIAGYLFSWIYNMIGKYKCFK